MYLPLLNYADIYDIHVLYVLNYAYTVLVYFELVYRLKNLLFYFLHYLICKVLLQISDKKPA
jgi:hypothetical protein